MGQYWSDKYKKYIHNTNIHGTYKQTGRQKTGITKAFFLFSYIIFNNMSLNVSIVISKVKKKSGLKIWQYINLKFFSEQFTHCMLMKKKKHYLI